MRNFFEKEFNNLIKLNDEFDKDIDFVEIVPGSTVLLDFIRDSENIQLVYEFEVRIRLETNLIDLLKKHVAPDTRNVFITQAIPSNKVELAKQIIKLVKTINKDWSPNARTYSSEQAMFASRLAEVISPYDEDNLNLLDLSDQTKDFLENVWGKNYYVENLFLEALNKIAVSAAVPNADELIKNTNISINDPSFLDEFYGEISDWFEVYPIDENEDSESKRVNLDYLLENTFKTNNFRRKFAGYLMTKNVNDK